MSLVLHQFKKEIRWLWPRWCLLLAALAFDLAFSLDWVLPMRLGTLMGYYELTTMLLWLVVFWVAISTAPEDSAEGGRAFTATRPVSRWHYWLGRLLVWIVLIVLPMMLETGLYLLLMQRPWPDVGEGMADMFLTAASATLWVLPASQLFRSWERYLALATLWALWGADYGRLMLSEIFKALQLWFEPSFPPLEPARTFIAACYVGPLLVLLLIWHSHRRLNLAVRLLALGVLLLLCHGLASSSLTDPDLAESENAALVHQLRIDHAPSVRVSDLRAYVRTDDQLGQQIHLDSRVHLPALPQGTIAMPWCDSMIGQQQGSPLSVATNTHAGYSKAAYCGFFLFGTPLAGKLPVPWPLDTLTADTPQTFQSVPLPDLPMLDDLATPIDLQWQFRVNWIRLQEIGHSPLIKGAIIKAPKWELQVLDIKVGENNRGDPAPSTITLTLRASMSTLPSDHHLWPGPLLMIHGQKQRLLWQREVTGHTDYRGIRHGWIHTLREVHFGGILSPGTGVTRANLSEQQLVWLQPVYLGTSHHSQSVAGLKLNEQLNNVGTWPVADHTVRQRANPREEFLAHLRRLKPPAEDAPEAEVAHFIAEVMSLSQTYRARHELNDAFQPKWPGNDTALGEWIAPSLLRFPDLLSRVQIQKDTAHVLGAILLHARIPGIKPGEGNAAPSYEQLFPTPSQPGVTQSLFSKPWWPSLIENPIPVVIAMLKTASDEPLRPHIRSAPPSIEETWKLFQNDVNAASLRTLLREEKYRPLALAEVDRLYAMLHRTVDLEESTQPIVTAKAATGDAGALDWILRWWATRDEERSSAVPNIQNAYLALFGTDLAPQAVSDLIRASRGRTSKNYRYDTAKMLWELLP